MNVKNCRKCGKIFNYVTGVPICPACKDSLEAKFQQVKKYIIDNKSAGIGVIAQDCEVEVSQLHQWIREERLQFAEDSPIRILCENCDTMILTGRFCEKCKMAMINGLNQAIKKTDPQLQRKRKDLTDNPKMRFLDRE